MENFVQPQLILNELIDDYFDCYNYRIQLEMLAILTATLLKYRQYPYDNLPNISKHFLALLLSNRRELRHGALECFTVICSFYNNYEPLTMTILQNNSSIRLLLSLIENLSYEAYQALRFRLQRNILPSLTDEGNITPGLVCDLTTTNDPDAKFILLVSTPAPTPQPTTIEPVSPIITTTTKTPPVNTKLLQFAMPLAETTTSKTTSNDVVSLFSNVNS